MGMVASPLHQTQNNLKANAILDFRQRLLSLKQNTVIETKHKQIEQAQRCLFVQCKNEGLVQVFLYSKCMA